MRKTISKKWLMEHEACTDGIDWWRKHGSRSVDTTLRRIHVEPTYASWLVKRLLSEDRHTAIRLAVYSAKLCLDAYTGDRAPLEEAIGAAEAVLADDCERTHNAARKAALAASEASAARKSARKSASAAWSAATAARTAASEARTAEWPAVWSAASAESAALSAASAESATWRQILDELIRLRKLKEMETTK